MILSDSPDGNYNKIYFAVYPDYYRTHWFGTYSFCVANNLQMLSLESQDEHDKFLGYCKKNEDAISAITGYRFNIYLNVFTFTTPNATGYVWYDTGIPFHKNLKIDWAPLEPNNHRGNSEYCATILRNNGYVGVNDYPCRQFTLEYFSHTIVCQKTKDPPTRGFRNKY